MKNIKSFFEVAVKDAGAEAVTALKLAVEGTVIETLDLKSCFLKYNSCVVSLTKVFTAFSVTKVCELEPLIVVSSEILVIV